MPRTTGQLLSIQVGRPRICVAADDPQKTWTTAIQKSAVGGPVHVSKRNVSGDLQADLEHHGGEDKAVLAYAAAHYAQWAVDLPTIAFTPGGFGENLTVAGFDETQCCVGDVWQVGPVRLQISQPRQPCWKLSRRWNLPNLAKRVQQTRRTGWYLRVLEVGEIAAGMTIELRDRPFADFTIAWALDVMYAQPRNSADDLLLAECPALSASWKSTLFARATRGQEPNVKARLHGDD
jgi:MOSC domain-containing protein YiiM